LLKITRKKVSKISKAELIPSTINNFTLLCVLIFTSQQGETAETRQVKNFDSHAYEIISQPMDWSEAQEYALSIGGNLVKVESFQENIFLRSLMAETTTIATDGGGAKYFWLGGTDENLEGSWHWTDDTALSPKSITSKDLWGQGPGFKNGFSEPDNFMGDQDCLAMSLEIWPAGALASSAYGLAGQWNDISCSNKLIFVVEYDTSANYENGTLNVKHLSAGGKSYQALLQLSPCATLCLKLVSAQEISLPSTPLSNSFSESILKIKKLEFGGKMYGLDLKLVDTAEFIFEVSSSGLTSSLVTYPSSVWISADPKTVSVDALKLQEAIDYAFEDVIVEGVASPQNTQGLVVIRHGVIIAERYASGSNKDSIATSWSSAKSFTSALTGIAIQKGFIASVEAPVSEFISEWKEGETTNITIKNLLMMSSGLKESGNDALAMYVGEKNDEGIYKILNNTLYSIENRVADPDRAHWLGAAYNWNYQNADVQIIGESIERSTGKPLAEFAQTELFSKIGMNAEWWKDGFDNYMPWCCIDATTRDFARFGLLFAREGKWEKNAIVPAEWVTESTKLSVIITPESKMGYGYLWWPDVSGEWFYAVGSRSNNIYVHPGLDLVVVRNSTLEFLGDEAAKDRATGAHVTEFPAKWDHHDFFELVIAAVNK
jgi:CubicO group peptidase (beta-lactamase class C family)